MITRVDLHLHTAERSGCAMSGAVDQLTAARAAGLAAVAITDHHALVSPDERRALQDRFPDLLLIPGIEITLDAEAEDIVVLGLDDPELTRGRWNWPDLHAFVRSRGGLSILAHPFRYASEIGLDLEACPPDALEAYSGSLARDAHRAIVPLARRLGVPAVANSDAHWTGAVGRFANRLDEPAASVPAVLAAIREGRFTAEVNPDGQWLPAVR
jgi:predicted metal-dependent phosphoesterase TrpH